MIQDILQRLSQEPASIVALLEIFDCGKIKVGARDIRFARDHNPNSGLNISIRLGDNDACLVKDFARNECNNIISWLCREKNESFRTVILSIKHILGLEDNWRPQQKRQIFGGVYDGIINRSNQAAIPYPDDILDQYLPIGNELWRKDGISLEIQREFDIRFDIIDNSIIIPWKNEFGEIIAVKNRVNGVPEEGMSKYYYSYGGSISSALYGYSDNYMYLQGADVFVGESEKQVLQFATKGYRNAVSLGSNSLSEQQARLMLSLNPRRVIWFMDEGLPKENTLRNAKVLNNYCAMFEVEQYWWNWQDSLSVDLGSKMSPGDCDKETFENILKYEIEKLDIKDESCLEDDDI